MFLLKGTEVKIRAFNLTLYNMTVYLDLSNSFVTTSSSLL